MANLYVVEILEIDSIDGEMYDVERYAFGAETDDKAREKAFGYAFRMGVFKNGDVVYFFPDGEPITEYFEIRLQKADDRGVLEEIDRACFDPIQEGLDFSLGFDNSNVRINLSEYDESYGGYRKRNLEVQNGEKTE